MKSGSNVRFSPWARVGIALALLALAACAAVLAFPGTRTILRTTWANAALLALLAACVGCALWALARRRWLCALFHAGAAAVIVGGGLTADHARTWQVGLVDSPIAPPEYATWRTEGKPDGEVVALESFTIETYPDGMPKQYRTRLRFPEGVREIAVNRPLRRKGLTYYQMSYARAWDPYGQPVWQTILSVRKDPGVPVVFAGYGALALAALGMAIRESLQ